MKLEKGYHFFVIFLLPSTVCKYGTGKTGRTSSLGLNCGTGNGWNRLWNRGAPDTVTQLMIIFSELSSGFS